MDHSKAAVPSGLRVASAFPSREQSLALQASLLEGDRAIEAWRKLSTVISPKEPGIVWIAPLMMSNLAPLLPGEPWVRENPHFLTVCDLKGRAITEVAQTILLILEEEGVPTLALKGLALGASVYPSAGLRPVSDLDLLVPPKDLFRAMEALKRRGWRPMPEAPRDRIDLRAGHAHAFHSENRNEPLIDLHWHVLQNSRGDDDDATFWTDARPLRVGTALTRALCPEDQLLHVLVHGVCWTRVPHVRWAADAVMILRAHRGEFGVQRFLEAVRRFDVVAPVQEGLRFVAEVLGEGAHIFEQVRSLRRSRFSERAFKARATAYENRSIADRITLRIEAALWAQRATRGAS